MIRYPWLLVPALALMAPLAGAATFTPLGFLPNSYDSRANGISADGTVVVGQSNNVAFRWTSSGGMTTLGGAFGSNALGVSADGQVIVGSNPTSTGNDAFRWTSGTGLTSLGILPGGTNFLSYAYAASADGSVVAGRAVRNIFEAFRWTAPTGMVGLGSLQPAPSGSEAYAISSDGSVVAGYSTAASGVKAMRWTSATGMVSLGTLPGQAGFDVSYAFGMSPDGSYIVGQAHNADQDTEAFRWTSAGGMAGLGDLPGGGFSSVARGVSADGSVVVGRGSGLDSFGNNAGLAFVWTESAGMQSLMDLLVARGATGLQGWTLYEATAITPDGNWVIGVGQNPNYGTEAFIANIAPIPVPPGAVLLASALAVLGRLRRRLRG